MGSQKLEFPLGMGEDYAEGLGRDSWVVGGTESRLSFQQSSQKGEW